MSQYILPIALPPVFSADNFFIANCNRDAWQWITAWPNWPGHALLLYGPAGSGKSHLGHIWSARAKSAVLAGKSITPKEPESKNILVEDIGPGTNERALLHLFNSIKENKGSLLLTSATAAAQLPFNLPDLTSRLLAIPSAHIAQADDEVLAGSMRKQFSDRQMKVDDDVIAYLVPRMERSLGKVRELVEKLDHTALAEKKHVTVPFVKRTLGL